MDLDSNDQPCTSKSIKTESLKTIHKNAADDPIVIIDDDDSLDSAYETGSAVSRSTQSSPTRKHFSFFFLDINSIPNSTSYTSCV